MRGVTDLDRQILRAAANLEPPLHFDADVELQITAAANRLISEGRLYVARRVRNRRTGDTKMVMMITPNGFTALKLDEAIRQGGFHV